MLAILAITTPIFLLIALGYLLVRVKLVPQAAIGGMGTFVVYLALPALLFKALSSRPVSDVYNSHYLHPERCALADGSIRWSVCGIGLAWHHRWESPI